MSNTNLEIIEKKNKHSFSKIYTIENPENKINIRPEIIESLTILGFDINQIISAYREHKFQEIKEACHIMMKDLESQKYNHKFLSNKTEENINLNECRICKGDPSEHIDFEIREKKKENKSNNNHNNRRFSLVKIQSQERRMSIKQDQIYSLNLENNIKENMNLDQSEEILMKEKSSMSISNIDESFFEENKKKLKNESDSENKKKLKHESDSENNIMNMDKNRSDLTFKNFNNYNKNKFEVAEEVKESFNDPNICTICFSEKLNEKNSISFNCGHSFCRNCVTNYITTNIDNGKVLNINCLFGGCKKTLIEQEIKMHIGDQLFKKYKKFKNEQIRLSDSKRSYLFCPAPNCESMILLSKDLNEDPFFLCPNQHKFCGKCKTIGWHSIGKCNDYVKEVLKQIKKDKNSITNNFQQCPNCFVIIEKNEGCNHMRCINCKYQFCWLCRKGYADDHFAIYNIRGCPGMRFGKIKKLIFLENSPKRKIWNNCFLKGIWYLLSFILGIFAIIGLFAFFLFFGCAYEFVMCWENKSFKFLNAYNNDGDSQNDSNVVESENLERNNTREEKFTIGLLIFLGVICQPFYLVLYFLYFMMECCRRFNFCFLYVE